MSESLKTPFYDCHLSASGKLVDFAGWSLPIHYGSLVDEHHAVRKDVGMFDVSHMVVSDIQGAASVTALSNLTTNDINKLTDNTALYSCLCNEQGGVVDDIIVYRITGEHYRVISNASTRSKVLNWFSTHGVKDVSSIAPGELAMIAVQGPKAVESLQAALNSGAIGLAGEVESSVQRLSELPNFGCMLFDSLFIGRTGYTGEDGFEVIVPSSQANQLWNALLKEHVKPCGLGARDTLRLEAGMSLYGNDLDEVHSPVDCGVGWTVDLSDESREFIARALLEEQKAKGSEHLRIGLELSERGVLRAGQPVVLGGKTIGVVTSGTFSPTLQRTIALARVRRVDAPSLNENNQIDDTSELAVEIRSKLVKARRVRVPFLANS